MNRLAKLFLMLLFGIAANQTTQAQGCSDAGFCTMGAMKPDQPFRKKVNIRLRSVEVSQYVGRTPFGGTILSYTADLNVGITNRLTAQIKLPYYFVTGKLGNNQGLSDLSLSLSQNLVAKENFQVSATIGAKIPIGKPNVTGIDGRPLPMYYQTTLGTYDLVLGISVLTKNWLIATGYQQAFGTSDNHFLWGRWAGSELKPVSDIYPLGNQLQRGKDIMLRVERNFRFAKFNFNIGLLPIWRLTKDTIINPAGNRVEVDGTTGMALTLLSGLGYRFSPKMGLKIGGGYRLQKRDRNPDGLARDWVTTVGLGYNF